MATVTQFLRARLLAGVRPAVPELAALRQTEISREFERLRMNRKVVGAMRYGLMGAAEKVKYDRVPCMIRRLTEYLTDRNAEHLVDVANLAELEFVEGDHRGVIATDDGQHTAAR